MSHQELRRAAAQKFMESLDQLESRLTASDEARAVGKAQPDIDPPVDAEPIALEEAAADIEEFMRQQSKN